MTISPFRPLRGLRSALALSALVFGLIALGAAPPARADDAQRYEQTGTAKVEVTELRWTDSARQRTLPLRLRLPETATATKPQPLILFSHGLGGSVDGGRFWGEHWASQGFVVIHIQHPGSDESVWKDAGGRFRAARAMKTAASGEQLEARAADVRFVIDELQRRQQAGDPLAQRIDLTRIGMSGHSFGAATTQALAGQRFAVPRRHQARADALAEPRIAAFIAFSPSARGDDAAPQFAAITRPFFSITGTADGEVGLGLGVPPAQRLLPFEFMPGPDKYLLNLDGADHAIFNGAPRWRDDGQADPQRDARHVAVVKATTLAFWQATLRDDAAARAWLAQGGAAARVGDQGRFSAK